MNTNEHRTAAECEMRQAEAMSELYKMQAEFEKLIVVHLCCMIRPRKHIESRVVERKALPAKQSSIDNRKS